MDLSIKLVEDSGPKSIQYSGASRNEFDRNKLDLASIRLRDSPKLEMTKTDYWKQAAKNKPENDIDCLEDLNMAIKRRFIKPTIESNTIDRDIDKRRLILPMTYYRQDNNSTKKDNIHGQPNNIQATNYDQDSTLEPQSIISSLRTSPSGPPSSRSQSYASSSRSSPQSSVHSRSPSPVYRSADYFATNRFINGEYKISSIEEEAANALLGLRGSSQETIVSKSTKRISTPAALNGPVIKRDLKVELQGDDNIMNLDDDNSYEEYRLINRLKAKQSGFRKRKIVEDDQKIVGITTECPHKKFASNPSPEQDNIRYDGDEDLNLACHNKTEPTLRFMFDERSDDQKKMMLDDLRNTITEEDIKYLRRIHDELSSQKLSMSHGHIPLGREEMNASLLNQSKTNMIERPQANVNIHPDWWRGCSRCDMIDLNGKQHSAGDEILEQLEEALRDQDVIRAASLGRQCRNRNISLPQSESLANFKLLTQNTLQARANDIRSSRTKR